MKCKWHGTQLGHLECPECANEKTAKVDSRPASCSEPPLGGRWHAGNGVLVNGTLRIAVASFDTDPPEDFQKEVFEWIAEKLNEAQNVKLTRRD